jgi:hypothetical protein
VGGEHDARARIEERPEGRERRRDARVVGDAPALERDVEVHAAPHAPPRQVREIADRELARHLRSQRRARRTARAAARAGQDAVERATGLVRNRGEVPAVTTNALALQDRSDHARDVPAHVGVFAQVGAEQKRDLVLLADELDGGERLHREPRGVVGEDRLEVRDRDATPDARELEVSLRAHALHRVEARGGAAARRDAIDEALEAVDQRLLADGSDDLDEHLERERLVHLVDPFPEPSHAAAEPLQGHAGAGAVLGVAGATAHLDDDRLRGGRSGRCEAVDRLAPHRVVGGRQLLDEGLEAGAVSDRRRIALFLDLFGPARDLLDGVLLEAALEAPPRRRLEEGNQREGREPDLRLFLRVVHDLEDAADGRLLPAFVELDEAVDRRDADLADLLALDEPLERRDRLGEGNRATHRAAVSRMRASRSRSIATSGSRPRGSWMSARSGMTCARMRSFAPSSASTSASTECEPMMESFARARSTWRG